ncbi:TfoX/Sxy family protein [Minwuia sp.]|uniref:TfoX/Sxy family protein n=1 Tax=Minwuia sp. TaxID=2493630 RepID=UPI003A94DE9F
MAVSTEFQDHLLELLEPMGGVSARRMFGGAGLFKSGLMFALIADEVVYFKVDDSNRLEFEDRGMGPFVYETKNGRQTIMGYWQMPDDLYDDPDEMNAWAMKAFDVALKADAAKPPSQRKRTDL